MLPRPPIACRGGCGIPASWSLPGVGGSWGALGPPLGVGLVFGAKGEILEGVVVSSVVWMFCVKKKKQYIIYMGEKQVLTRGALLLIKKTTNYLNYSVTKIEVDARFRQ